MKATHSEEHASKRGQQGHLTFTSASIIKSRIAQAMFMLRTAFPRHASDSWQARTGHDR